MRSFWYLLYLCHAVLAGDLYSPVSYAYPAASPLVAPQPISPLHFASPLRTSTGYGPLAAARFNHFAAPVLAPAPLAAAPAPAVVASPTAYAAPAPAVVASPTAYTAPAPAVVASPTAYAAPVAPVLTRYAAPAAYAAPVLQKYAAVPAIADVPITRYEARPGFIQKYVDFAHPKIATSKIQIRRPAIQKQFYDIEERIVVRPIASAVVELDPPLSKTQAGPTLVSSALPAAPGFIPAPIPVSPLPPGPVYGPPQNQPPPSGSEDQENTAPSAPENPQYPPPSAPQNPQFPPPTAPQNPQFPPPSAPQFPPPSAPQNPQFPEIAAPDNGQESDDSDSITIESENVRARSGMQQQPQGRQFQPQPEERSQQQNGQMEQEQPQAQARSGSGSLPPQQIMSQTEARFLSRSQGPVNNFAPQLRSFSGDVIPSSRAILTEEQSQSNQQRLIELLTGRGGVAEVRSGISVDAAGEAGQIRGRVLSVTPAPQTGPADEKVSTRRVVVSRPIQTLQEVDVVQPFTKIQRLSVQQPALLKTQRVDIARLKTFAPVPVSPYASYGPYSFLH